MDRHRGRRALLCAFVAGIPLARRALAQTPAERLIAALQDGGKIIYLRQLPAGRVDDARDLGRALRALRVPLNEIVAGPMAAARETAGAAFGAERVGVLVELAVGEQTGDRQAVMVQEVRRLLRTEAGPGMNRVLVGDRPPLEMAAERRFPESVLPEGAMAVFLPGGGIQMLGTITAQRVIASAKARGAL